MSGEVSANTCETFFMPTHAEPPSRFALKMISFVMLLGTVVALDDDS
jgi:hypothetical protein